MEERAAGQIPPGGAGAGGGDEGGAAGQRPFGARLRPVAGAGGQRLGPRGGARQAQGALGPGQGAGGLQMPREARDVGLVVRGVGVLEERHGVGGGVVEAGEEQRVRGDSDAAAGEAGAHLTVVEERGQEAGVDVARKGAAGAAMEAAEVRVVDRAGAVAGQEHEAREA